MSQLYKKDPRSESLPRTGPSVLLTCSMQTGCVESEGNPLGMCMVDTGTAKSKDSSASDTWGWQGLPLAPVPVLTVYTETVANCSLF